MPGQAALQGKPAAAPVLAAAPRAGSRGALACLGWAGLAAIAAFALLALQPEPVPPPLEGTTQFRLPDGRLLAYDVRGKWESAQHAAFWLHGIISSRYEAMSTELEVLHALDLVLIGVDRPGYGASTRDPHRSFQTFAKDLTALAESLGIFSFFVVGVSGGGPYALAAAHYLPPGRVRGVLTISSPAPAGLMTPGERAEWDRRVGPATAAFASLYRRHEAVARAVRDWALTRTGGWALFWTVLRPLALNAKRTMAHVDVACLDNDHPEYFQAIVPESLRQRSGAPLFEDLAIFLGEAWAYNVSSVSPQLAAATHFWHGTGDLQVPDVSSRALHRLLPGSSLTVVPGGGHFSYYVCHATTQRTALSRMLVSAAAA
ncbi:hypothetical protein WJX81_003767 [Elliptochloris bilobata]|uniref:AB hydrolase-1 domain-containing protein n=1 Tax=Elliptochloris bilobata TaxID=381761 RepID=A0AAW1QVM6_9CHLO